MNPGIYDMTAAEYHAAPVPGIYDMTDAQYHADPVPGGSLSNTGIKYLLEDFDKGCPARFKHWRENPEQYESNVYLFGRAAHSILLGGPMVECLRHDSYRKKAAQEERDAALAVGSIPMLEKDYMKVLDMVIAAKDHPHGKALFRQQDDAEKTLIWQCEDTGVWCRAKVDKVHAAGLLVDYKTCATARPDDLERSIIRYGYHVQDAWYREGARATGLIERPGMVFFFQEKEAPYLCTAVQLSEQYRALGSMITMKAKQTFAHCKKTGEWPSYNNGKLVNAEPPQWAITQFGGFFEEGE